MTVFYLSKKGYGTLEEIRGLDTPDYLNLVEYESICNDIEQYEMEKK